MANFTQQESVEIQAMIADIESRMSKDGLTALKADDKPIADGYTIMRTSAIII